MLGFFIALISGVLMSVQGVFNTGVTKESSIWLACAWVSFLAFITAALLWFFTEKTNIMTLFTVSSKYMLLGGILGAGITYTVIKSMEIMGPANSVLIIVISQIISAYIIQLFGMFKVEKVQFSFSKLIGLVIAVIGVIVFEKK